MIHCSHLCLETSFAPGYFIYAISRCRRRLCPLNHGQMENVDMKKVYFLACILNVVIVMHEQDKNGHERSVKMAVNFFKFIYI